MDRSPRSLAGLSLNWQHPVGAAMTDRQAAHDREAAFVEAMDRATTPYAVYRYFDHLGRLLYVGITREIERRTDRHSCSPFAPFAVARTIFWYSSRKEARTAELRAIKTEFPIFNQASATELTKKLRAEYMSCTANQLRVEVARARYRAEFGANLPADPERRLMFEESMALIEGRYDSAVGILDELNQ